MVAANPLLTNASRVRLWRWAGMSVGDDVDVRPHTWVFSDRLTIGDGVLLGYDCHIENREAVAIGAGCAVAPQVTILTSTHTIGARERRAGPYAGLPVAIGAGCWVGARAIILPGVTLGDGCVVGAGSVVTRDVDADTVVAGVPAMLVREL
jgi:maltose O-acetyltransferase